MRASAISAFAFAAFQFAWLPAPVSRAPDGLVWEWGTMLHLAISIGVGVLVWRGSRIAAAVLGALGAYLLGWALIAIISVPTGTWERFGPPAWVFAQLVRVPFAVPWVLGGIAVLRERRRRRAS